MSHGLDEILRYFLLALLWLFFIYAARMVLVEVRRARAERAAAGSELGHERAGQQRRSGMRLRVLAPPERSGQTFELGGEVTLGRSPACVIAFEKDTFASSVHARIFEREGGMWLEDLGSRNGTFLNDQRLSGPAPLERGDRLKVGTTVLEVAR